MHVSNKLRDPLKVPISPEPARALLNPPGADLIGAYQWLEQAGDAAHQALNERTPRVQHGGVRARDPRGTLGTLKASEIDPLILSAARLHAAEALGLIDRLIGAKDPVTGLLPLHVRTEDGRLVAADHLSTGLDMGRMTAGLVMASKLARAMGDSERAAGYLRAAEENYAAGRTLLLLGPQRTFAHRKNFDDRGATIATEVGEPGRSAPGEDNMARVNASAYAIRAVAELCQATPEGETAKKGMYKLELEQLFDRWVRLFHDDQQGGFFTHANVEKIGDHKENVTLRAPGGEEISTEVGRAGLKGNDGTVYGLSAILLSANQILATAKTQQLVKEQMDLILDRFHRERGMLWENYDAQLNPLSADWQSQPMHAEPGAAPRTSHVAIGGHTAMAPQQVIEGARQLRAQKVITPEQYQRYVNESINLFQTFATESGAIDWSTGAVHNAMRVEEPDRGRRWLSEWGDAAWQQAELIQTLLRFREEGALDRIRGPDGKTGADLLRLAELHYARSYALPSSYSFDQDIGNPDPYHRPQLALYHQELIAQLEPQALVRAEARLAATQSLSEATSLLSEVQARRAPRAELDRAIERLRAHAAQAKLGIDDIRDAESGMSFAMAAAAAGDQEAYARALQLGSHPAKDRNPQNGATQAHYAALATRALDDRAPPEKTAGAEILRTMEKKIGLQAMVNLVNTRNTLSEHNVFTDAVFYRNNGALGYLYRDLGERARERGLSIDFNAPTARGILPRDLMQRSPGSFSPVIREAQELRGPVRGPDGTEYENAALMREVRHRAWARDHGLDENDVIALIAAAEAHDFERARALIAKLGLKEGMNARIGYLGQTLLHFNVMGRFAQDSDSAAALDFQEKAVGAGADPRLREEGLMAVDAFIRAAALGRRELAFHLAAVVKDRQGAEALKQLLDRRGVNNGRTALADAIYALDWDSARRLLDLGADPRAVSYDGLALAELAEINARANKGEVPADIGERLGQV